MQSGKTGYPYYHSATFVANTMQTIRKLLVMILSCIVWLWLPPQIQAAKKQHKSSRTISKAWTNKDWRLTPIPTMYTIPLKAISRVDQQQQQQQIKSVAPEHKWILLHFLFCITNRTLSRETWNLLKTFIMTLSVKNMFCVHVLLSCVRNCHMRVCETKAYLESLMRKAVFHI